MYIIIVIIIYWLQSWQVHIRIMWEKLKNWWWGQPSNWYKINPPSQKITFNKIFWFECIGMFVFVFLQACVKQPIGIHLQITLILAMAIPMCVKISGAHYNPAVTVSNFLCRYNRAYFSSDILWMYFKAQVSAATFALGLGYIVNNHFLASLALPSEQISSYRIFFSQFWATALLVFYTQLVANNQTTFTNNDGQKYFFIIAFVFVARRSAHVSAFAINPAITIATVVLAVLTCSFSYVNICTIYLAGDFLGSIFGTLVYNKFYVPSLEAARLSQIPQVYETELSEYIEPELQKLQSIVREQSTQMQRNLKQIQMAEKQKIQK